MSPHTRCFTIATSLIAVVACTVVALDLPTLLDFTGVQVEMLRTSLMAVPLLACVTGLLRGIDLLHANREE